METEKEQKDENYIFREEAKEYYVCRENERIDRKYSNREEKVLSKTLQYFMNCEEFRDMCLPRHFLGRCCTR